MVCKIDLFEEIEPDRRGQLRVKYILDGETVNGELFQDRFFLRWWVHRDVKSLSGWTILREELVDGVRVQASGRGFVSLPPSSAGVDFVHQRDPKLTPQPHEPPLRFGVMPHAFGGLSAVDYDLDGRPDLFFADGVRSRLYHHEGVDAEGRPRFLDTTDEIGLGVVDQASAGLWADFDHDGDSDLFVARYRAPCMYFQNRGDGTVEECAEEMGLAFDGSSVSACLLDYDRDGWVDIYLSVYGNAFQDVPRIPFFARNGGANRLFRNDSGRRFQDVTTAAGVGDTGWSLAVCAGDYDDDGDDDLAVANDFGRKVLYRNEGDGTFADVSKAAGVLDFSGGMGVAFGDLNRDGRLDLYTSNISSNQRWFGEQITVNQYIRNVIRTKWVWKDLDEYFALHDLVGDDWKELGKVVGEGNSMFLNAGNGRFEEWHASRTNRAGWSWGVALFDADNDADLDCYTTNGWISNTPGADL